MARQDSGIGDGIGYNVSSVRWRGLQADVGAESVAPLSIELDLDPITRDYRTCDAENPISTVREGRRGARIGGGGEAW